MDKGALHIEEPEGPRWQSALEILAEGHPVSCMGLGLVLRHRGPGEEAANLPLTVSMQTRYIHRTLTPELASAEIENAQAGVEEIRRRSPQFDAFVREREIIYRLIDVYGMGAAEYAVLDSSGFHFQPRG